MPENKNAANAESIAQLGVAETPESPIACVSIIGQIEGHMVLPETSKATKYEHILPLLVNIEQSEKTKGFLLVLNTVGGDVEAGLAIAEMVAGMRKPSVSLVIGGGGLGQIAITYGYQKYDDQIVWLCVALTILIVQILQEFGMYIARRTDRRAHS